MDCVGAVLGVCFIIYNNKLRVGVYEAGNGHGIRVHQVEPLLNGGREQ